MDSLFYQGIEICKEELNKEKNKQLIENEVLDPIIKYIGNKLWPYILYLLIFTLFILVILIYIIFIVNKKNKLI